MRKIVLTFLVFLIFTAKAFAGDYYIVGVDCFKKGLYDKAEASLEHAVRISPKNVNARYYLAQCYLINHQTEDAIAQYNRIMFLAPSSAAAKMSEKGLHLIAQSYRDAKKAGPSTDNADNYLSYVLASDGTIKKWKKFPVAVYIEPKKQKFLALKACKEWQAKTGNIISFKFVDSPKSAQITFDFMNKLESSSTKDSYIAGYSKPYYQGDYIVKSEIHILTIDPTTKKDVEDDYVYFSALHELGHSMGFAGHSPNSNDVMFGQSEVAKTSLTQRDINTMTALYTEDNKTVVASNKGKPDVQLKQALDYVKDFPDKAVGWANLGDLYRGKNNYAEAAKNYKKAISIEPDKAELYNLLGATDSLMNDTQGAYENLKKACDLDKNNLYYMYQFGQECAKAGKIQVGKDYLNSFVKSNPQALNDEKIRSLMNTLR